MTTRHDPETDLPEAKGKIREVAVSDAQNASSGQKNTTAQVMARFASKAFVDSTGNLPAVSRKRDRYSEPWFVKHYVERWKYDEVVANAVGWRHRGLRRPCGTHEGAGAMTDEQWEILKPYAEARNKACRNIEALSMTNTPSDIRRRAELDLAYERCQQEQFRAEQVYSRMLREVLGAEA